MTLNFTVSEASDNSLVTIQDTTSDWEVGAIQDVFDNGAAAITVVILGVSYDPIDVTSYFDGGSQEALAFIINPEDLLIGGEAQYSADDLIPDGDWEVTYEANHTIGGAISDSETDLLLVYGSIEKICLQMLRITEVNPLTFEETLKRAMIRLAHYSYLKGIINSAYSSEIANLRTSLADLETMVENGKY